MIKDYIDGMIEVISEFTNNPQTISKVFDENIKDESIYFINKKLWDKLMTPLEINKRIAEKKGYIFDDKYRCFSKEKPHDKNAIYKDSGILYNWAENISDAWELFEEMPDASIFKVDSKILKKEYSNLIYSASCKDIGLKSYSAETAPLAICLTWISWKEGQNK